LQYFGSSAAKVYKKRYALIGKTINEAFIFIEQIPLEIQGKPSLGGIIYLANQPIYRLFS
jgi:hypothetical protein